MAIHGIEMKTTFADGTGWYYAAARSLREGLPRGNSLGIGRSAGEALCHAAAQAFEDATREAPPEA
ncbi:MAG: hypothetical protein M3Q10_13835 [Chloroflexota bacterium]|nr:hypothetical protein [Chloroflexota bacterium]